MPKKIYVTKPFLPPLEEYKKYLDNIWESNFITNSGPYHDQLESELCDFLGVKHISLFCNGTIALLVGIKALELKGEVITTPYSFVATAQAIKWNGLDPVFVDIEPKYCNLDPSEIEQAITEKTSAILPVHVYGHPCDTKTIKRIANKYNLRVMYDSAHAFAVKKDKKSILNEGDLSVLSFHATKVFNTFEGGAIISGSHKMKKKIDDLKNFAFQDETTVNGLGINGKMNEAQAAFGLLQLKYIINNIKSRKKISEIYREQLSNISGIKFTQEVEEIDYNYSYMPVLINKKTFGISRDKLYEKLKKSEIFSRRYFYPLITDFPVYKNSKSFDMPNAKLVAKQILCLPIYPDLSVSEINRICKVIKER